MATNYEYFYKEMQVPSNRLNAIYVLRTHASNIKLVNLRAEYGSNKKLIDTDYYGVNGAFFMVDTGAILNISWQDGTPVGPGSGSNWNATGKSAIGWTGSILTAYNGLTALTAGSSLEAVFKNEGSWIQGGIGLHLGNTNWENLTCDEMRDEDGNFSDDDDEIINAAKAHTAMVARISDQMVDLIVSDANCTVEEFRYMIQTHLGISDTSSADNYYYRGILLDGGRSTQMVVEDNGDIIEAPEALGVNLLMRAVPHAVVLVDKS